MIRPSEGSFVEISGENQAKRKYVDASTPPTCGFLAERGSLGGKGHARNNEQSFASGASLAKFLMPAVTAVGAPK